MVNAGESAPGGHHGLGPHVVGVRVVIRRILPGETGPTGGPAFTDVLGVCERWDVENGGHIVLRTATGEVVSIPQALIVSGKPVPPRRSRLERISRDDIDTRAGIAGQPVWLGSVSQLARTLPAASDAHLREDSDRARFEEQSTTAIVARHDDWVVVETFTGDTALLAAVVEWAAEQGASTLAVTDQTRAALLAEIGFVSR